MAGPMDYLSVAAKEIGKVTETITSISAQTNLLAINATIEGDRAGSAGIFLVVVVDDILLHLSGLENNQGEEVSMKR
jgi:methyl-accepting chemotaxis protein